MELPWEFPPAFAAACLAQLGLGLILALALALRGGSAGIGLPRSLAAGAGIAAASAGSVLFTRLALDAGQFALLTHAFVGLLSLSITGAAVLVCARRLTPWGRAAAACASLGLPVLAWASLVEPYALERVEVAIPLHALRAGSTPLRLGVLSDLQTVQIRSHEHAAVDLLLEGRPDVILLPGDLYQGPPERWEQVAPGFRELLQRLVAPGGAYLVPGDCDTNARLAELVRGTPVQLLLGESELIQVGERQLRILGADLRRPDRPALASFARAARAAPGELRVLLAHRPGSAMDVPVDAPIDLVVAGHTHGGQVRLPGGRALVDLSPVPNRIGGGGLHQLGHQRLYVSRGVGMERSLAPRIRLGCPPEVSILVLGDGSAPPD